MCIRKMIVYGAFTSDISVVIPKMIVYGAFTSDISVVITLVKIMWRVVMWREGLGWSGGGGGRTLVLYTQRILQLSTKCIFVSIVDYASLM